MPSRSPRCPTVPSCSTDGDPYLVLGDELLLWSPSGYAARRPRPATGTATVITPASLVDVLRAGWHDAAVPLLHPAATGM